MTLTFTNARIQNDNGVWLCLKVNEPAQARQFAIKKQNRLYDAEIKQHREKRSLDANSFYWLMVGDLAKAIGDTPENIYRRHIRDIGNYETICMKTEAVEDFTRHWTSNHLGRFVETRESKLLGCTTVLAFYGSSDFSKSEMSRLIDNCLQDCEATGIDTTPQDKISLLLEEWGNAPTN